jgi:hypothetical protein
MLSGDEGMRVVHREKTSVYGAISCTFLWGGGRQAPLQLGEVHGRRPGTRIGYS